MCADIPARGFAIPGSKAPRPPLTASDRLMRRVFRALLWTLALSTGFVAAAPAGETFDVNLAGLGRAFAAGDDRPVNFFVDIASTRLAEEVKTTEKRRLNLAGVPVLLGAQRQDGAAGPSVTAGIAGKYDWQLAPHWSLEADGQISRAQVIDTALPSSARAGGAFAVKLAEDGTRLQLRPSFSAGLQEDALQHVDYGIDAKLQQEIADGFDVTATAGRSWHDAMLFDTEDREFSYGRLGLRFDLSRWSLPEGSDLELAYQLDCRDGLLASQFRTTQSVLVLARMLEIDGWSLRGRYAYSATERGYDDADWGARRHDWRHRVTLESDWDLGSSSGADWHMTAAYGFEQSDSDDTVAEELALHSATVSFALNF